MNDSVYKKQAGFTLIEIVIAMAIVSGVAYLIIIFSRNIAETSLRLNQGLFTQQQIQQTLQIIVPEIRSVSQSNTGGYPLSSVTSTTMEFYSDIDRDGLFDRVRYFLSDSTFKKGVVKPTGNPLAYVTSTEIVYDLVSNMIAGNQIFSYYDANATSTASAQLPFPIDVLKVKMIRISLVANQGTSDAPSIVGEENQATIRNLRYD